MKITIKAILIFICFIISGTLSAQDSNITYSIERIENMIMSDSIEIAIPRDIRFKGDKAKFAVLKRYSDGFFINVKIKKAAKGGQALNNQPRYEIAAYKIQELFLDTSEYVVPPTLGRGFTREQFSVIEKDAEPTFKESDMVFCDIQYWLNNVTKDNVFDKERFKNDSLYAKHIGNLNILTYLIRHSDSNEGNFLVSTDSTNPRVFVVDNGLAFGDAISRRGYKWRDLRVDRLPEKTIDRLKKITKEDLEDHLLVVSQFRIENRMLIPEPATQPINTNKGVRITDDTLQFGLTSREIQEVYWRLETLLNDVKQGRIETF
ncbi:hypothetical protein GF337_05875 [candidate division KSB1 bacterium]|nr:hypothetical protein [candidate division KSB1 bacterium]